MDAHEHVSSREAVARAARIQRFEASPGDRVMLPRVLAVQSNSQSKEKQKDDELGRRRGDELDRWKQPEARAILHGRAGSEVHDHRASSDDDWIVASAPLDGKGKEKGPDVNSPTPTRKRTNSVWGLDQANAPSFGGSKMAKHAPRQIAKIDLTSDSPIPSRGLRQAARERSPPSRERIAQPMVRAHAAQSPPRRANARVKSPPRRANAHVLEENGRRGKDRQSVVLIEDDEDTDSAIVSTRKMRSGSSTYDAGGAGAGRVRVEDSVDFKSRHSERAGRDGGGHNRKQPLEGSDFPHSLPSPRVHKGDEEGEGISDSKWGAYKRADSRKAPSRNSSDGDVRIVNAKSVKTQNITDKGKAPNKHIEKRHHEVPSSAGACAVFEFRKILPAIFPR